MSVKWANNLTKISKGIFMTMNGNANTLIAIGRMIKAGFICSKVEVKNAKYNSIIDISNNNREKLLRVQITGTSTNTLSFMGGYRSGEQINKEAKKRDYKYTKKDCDIFLGINSNNGECYIIPIEDIKNLGNTENLSNLGKYRENWNVILALQNSI